VGEVCELNYDVPPETLARNILAKDIKFMKFETVAQNFEMRYKDLLELKNQKN
jgi:hypothetical protein